MPQLFVDSRYVGGEKEITRMHASGDLRKLLEEANAIWKKKDLYIKQNRTSYQRQCSVDSGYIVLTMIRLVSKFAFVGLH